MKIIFFFATFQEAVQMLRMVNAREREKESGHYLFSEGEIVICGMGGVSARAAALKAQVEDAWWVNLGVAGSLDSTLHIGQAVRIGVAAGLTWDDQKKRYCHRQNEQVVLDDALPGTVFSAPVPLYRAPEVGSTACLVDMEGYALACAAREVHARLSMIKVVSDFCTDDSHEVIAANMERLSFCLAEQALGFNTQHPA